MNNFENMTMRTIEAARMEVIVSRDTSAAIYKLFLSTSLLDAWALNVNLDLLIGAYRAFNNKINKYVLTEGGGFPAKIELQSDYMNFAYFLRDSDKSNLTYNEKMRITFLVEQIEARLQHTEKKLKL